MTINLFDFGSIQHGAQVGATFVILGSVAICIDRWLRWCEAKGTAPFTLKVLHVTANGLLVADAGSIIIEAARPLFGEIASLIHVLSV